MFRLVPVEQLPFRHFLIAFFFNHGFSLGNSVPSDIPGKVLGRIPWGTSVAGPSDGPPDVHRRTAQQTYHTQPRSQRAARFH